MRDDARSAAERTPDEAAAVDLERLRRKWGEVPSGLKQRRRTEQLLELSDEDLLATWLAARARDVTGEGFSHRGWYHRLYGDVFRGKRIIDFGSEFGIDGISFAQMGADVTCVDIVPSNLAVIKRLCAILGVSNLRAFYEESVDALSGLPNDYDVVFAQGSLHAAPFPLVREEAQELLRHLRRDGGRWIQLAYPKERWEREGRQPFSKWGETTDGEGTPWGEWYDLAKILRLLEPSKFEVILAFNFRNDDFNWFDLIRRT